MTPIPDLEPSMQLLPTEDLWLLALGRRLGKTVALHAASLREISSGSVHEIAIAYGIPAEKAERISAVLELGRRISEERLQKGSAFRSSRDIFRHFGPRMRDLKVEQFRVLMLDAKHRVIADKLISQGTLTSSPVHPREVFGAAIRMAAAAVVLIHNHPSGDPTPSCDDLEVTRRLREVGDLVGIQVLDHVILGDGSFTSLADRGLL